MCTHTTHHLVDTGSGHNAPQKGGRGFLRKTHPRPFPKPHRNEIQDAGVHRPHLKSLHTPWHFRED